jgi:hypothetical protein
MPKYQLVNPYIIGSMNTSFEGNSSLEAAKSAYENLSQYFGNTMPSFRFSLKRLSADGKVKGGSEKSFLHFEATEKKGKNNLVTFEINQIEADKNIQPFQQRLNKVVNQDLKHKANISGGKGRKGSKKMSHKARREVKGVDSEDSVLPKKNKYVDAKNDYDEDLSDYFDSDYDRPRKGPLIYEPISYYWYDPYIYPFTDNWYMPTFVLPLQPRITIDSHTLLNLGNSTYNVGYIA